jgi:hypothetical protein
LNPFHTANFLGAVVIGEIPPGHEARQIERIQKIFEQIPLPRKDRRPDENCVSWAKDAVVSLQREGLVEERPGGIEGIEGLWEVGMMQGERIVGEGVFSPGDVESRFVRLTKASKKHKGSMLDRVRGLFSNRGMVSD